MDAGLSSVARMHPSGGQELSFVQGAVAPFELLTSASSILPFGKRETAKQDRKAENFPVKAY